MAVDIEDDEPDDNADEDDDDIDPLASDDVLRAWREREDFFLNLVDRATRRVTPQGKKVLPMDADDRVNPKGYQRRYVCRSIGSAESCFSVGVRDPFRGHITPIWLRFHCNTGSFSEIRARLAASDLSQRLVESGSHIWIPLDVPLKADGEQLVDSLVAQID
jgi:hypothetical protein